VVESLVEGDDGLLNRLEAGSLIIDMSSSKPDSTRRLAQAADGAGILYVDAPVSGGVAKAVSGDLTFMLGGKPAAIDLAEPHLKPMAGALFQLGPSGSGHAAKALNNLLSATNIAAASEVLTAAVRNGINPAVMIKVINASTGRSQASEVKFPRHILTGTWDSGFAFDLMLKDLGIARELIDAQDLYSPVTASAFAVAQAARSEFAGEATLDHTELAKYYEFLAGVEFRSEPSDPTA
jgi:3-hydroxyisobutyrate dehydrogenase